MGAAPFGGLSARSICVRAPMWLVCPTRKPELGGQCEAGREQANRRAARPPRAGLPSEPAATQRSRTDGGGRVGGSGRLPDPPHRQAFGSNGRIDTRRPALGASSSRVRMNLLIALGGTVVLALLIGRVPFRRVVRFKPGEAIRYGSAAPPHPVSRPWTRLRAWARGAATRTDVLLFSGAMAILAVHAAVDSFIAPEPGTSSSITSCEGRCRLRSSWLQRSPTRASQLGGARPSPQSSCAGARGSHPGHIARRARRRPPRRGLDGVPFGSGRALASRFGGSPAVAFAQARSLALASPCRDWPRHCPCHLLAGTAGRTGDPRHPSLVLWRPSSRPTSAGRTRR